MPSNVFRFDESWDIPDATPDEVWRVLAHAELLPEWWEGVYREATPLDPGKGPHVGGKARVVARGALPYFLRFEIEAVELTPGRSVTVATTGDFEGRWRAVLSPAGTGTHVDLTWEVTVMRPILKWLSPLLRPAFAWNHRWTTPRGEAGLRRYLDRQRSTPAEPDAPVGASLLLPVIVASGNFMTGLDQNVVVTALPEMARSLGVTPDVLSLTITAYVAALIAALPLGGWASERFGARRVYCAAMLLFTVASALCGLAGSFEALVAARVAQGFGGALMGTVGQVAVLSSFPRSRTLRINTYISMSIQVAPLIGPLVGGALATYASWRWIFYLNVPIGLAAMALAWRVFPPGNTKARAPFDAVGFILVGGGTALAVLGLNGLAEPRPRVGLLLAELVSGLVLLALALRHFRRTAYPLLDLTVLRIRTFRTAMLTGGGLDTIALTSVLFLLPLMLQVGFGMSAAQSGSLTFLAALSSLLTRPAMPVILGRLGFRSVLVANTPLLGVLIGGFALFQADAPIWIMAGWIFVFGIFRTIQWGSTGNLSYVDVPADKLTRFSAMYFIVWQMGVAVSIGTAAAVLAVLKHAGGDPAFPFRVAFAMEALLTFCALFAYTRLRPEDGRGVSGHAPAVQD